MMDAYFKKQEEELKRGKSLRDSKTLK